jgi:hypothetical protein
VTKSDAGKGEWVRRFVEEIDLASSELEWRHLVAKAVIKLLFADPGCPGRVRVSADDWRSPLAMLLMAKMDAGFKAPRHRVRMALNERENERFVRSLLFRAPDLTSAEATKRLAKREGISLDAARKRLVRAQRVGSPELPRAPRFGRKPRL